MKTALLIVFYSLSGALAVALNWIIWGFIIRMWRDQYRRLRDRRQPD